MTAAGPVSFLHHRGGMRNGTFGKTNDFADRLARFRVVWERNEIIATAWAATWSRRIAWDDSVLVAATVPRSCSRRIIPTAARSNAYGQSQRWLKPIRLEPNQGFTLPLIARIAS